MTGGDREEDPLEGLARHGAWQMAATLVPGVYTILLIAYLLRTLGPEAYAPWATAGVIAGWLGLLDVGLSFTTTREAARATTGEPEAMSRLAAANAAYAFLGGAGAALGTVVALAIPVVLQVSGTAALDAWLVGVLLTLDLAIFLGSAGWVGTARGGRRFDLLLVSNIIQVAIAAVSVVVLLPPFGIVGAAAAQPIGRLVGRIVLAALLQRRFAWFRARPRWPGWARLRPLWSFSIPILAIQAASQIGIGSDLFVVGAAAGATAVGLYAAGSQLVRYVGFFLFPAVAVLLPSFSAAARTRPDLVPNLLQRAVLLGGLFGGSVFGGVLLQAPLVVDVWSGQSSRLSTDVLALYAATWAVVTPSYVMLMMLVALGKHAVVGAVVLAESVLSLALSIVLVQAYGPVGAAVGTALAVGVDYAFVIPAITARRLGVRPFAVFAPAAGGLLAGFALAVLVDLVPVPGVPGLVVRGILGAALLAVCLWIAVPATRRMATIAGERVGGPGDPRVDPTMPR